MMRRTVSQFFGQPLLLPLSHRAAMLENVVVALRAPRANSTAAAGRERRGYDLINGVARIPVCGVLVHQRTMWGWDEVSYDEIGCAIIDALADDAVSGICLWVNSPGGEVSGCFDLCDSIYALRGAKPMLAVADELACSAAYAIASSADAIVLPRTAVVGSVGVITMHMDITKMLDMSGIKVTTIQFGERKADSYPTTPLSEEAEERLQADVDKMGEMFVSMVARNRGMRRSAVRDTEAGTYLGDAAVEVGFADAVAPVDLAILEFCDEVNK